MRIGEETVHMACGDAYVLPSHTPIEIFPNGRIGYIAFCFKNSSGAFLRNYEPQKSFLYRDMGKWILKYMMDVQKGQIQEEALAAELIQLFSLVKKVGHVYPETVSQVMLYLRKHSENKYDLDELSRYMHLSKYHLTRIYKKATGITPKQYHQQCRLRAVKRELLLSTPSSVAYDMGFSSQSHLEKIFMEYMGISMGRYISAVKAGIYIGI